MVFPATSPEIPPSWHLFRPASGGFPADTAGTAGGGNSAKGPTFPFETLPSPVTDDTKDADES